MIGSFFDVFTEISTDGGANWSPAQQAAHVELRGDPMAVPPVVAPSNLLPPRNDLYISPTLFHLLLQNGIVIRDIKHLFFTQSSPPPLPGSGPQSHHFDSQVDMQVSTDSGNTFTSVSVPAGVDVVVAHQANLGGTDIEMYTTEMTALNLQFAANGQQIMARESPPRRSEGGTAIEPAASDGTRRIHSFFDVFPEVSLDGGQTWTPSDSAAHVALDCKAPEIAKPSPNLPPPDGRYVSPADYHAAYAAGIVIKDVSHDRFTQSQPPPPAGGSQTENFGSRISGMISM